MKLVTDLLWLGLWIQWIYGVKKEKNLSFLDTNWLFKPMKSFDSYFVVTMSMPLIVNLVKNKKL